MSKRTKADFTFLLKQKIVKPIRANDEDFGDDYKPIQFTRKFDDKESLYDEVFMFLYNAPYYYTKILSYIDSIQKEYGYLVPVPYGLVARTVEIDEKSAEKAIYHMRRKGILFQYEEGSMRIRCMHNKNKLFKRMLFRHPTITLNKGLGYINKK